MLASKAYFSLRVTETALNAMKFEALKFRAVLYGYLYVSKLNKAKSQACVGLCIRDISVCSWA